MRTMYDSVNIANLPADAVMVAGYTSGQWPTFASLAEHFPNAVRVAIAVNSAHDADVLDVESGDATARDAPGWVQRQRARGATPTIYCSTSVWPEVIAELHLAGVPIPLWWEAHYDGKPVLSAGSVAKQYANNDKYDTSVVADYWPGVDPTPAPVPAPPPSVPAAAPVWSVNVQTIDLRNALSAPVTGKSVKALQGLLNVSGAALTVDGVAGARTRAAFGAFQARAGVAQDFIAGPNSWERLCSQ